MAAVASQKQGTLLRLVTPQASATVVGTRFKLATVERSTRLEVFEGAVSVLAGNAAPSLLVPAGHGVTVIPGQTVMLQRLAGDRGSVLLENWDPAGSPTNRIALSQLMFVSAELKPGHVRARGYLHPPRSGVYSFQINGTAGTELWLSDSDQPTAAKRVWPLADDAQPTAALPLRADRRYYVELRCAPSTESPSATVSWTMPGGLQRVIYGEYLSPFGPVGNP